MKTKRQSRPTSGLLLSGLLLALTFLVLLPSGAMGAPPSREDALWKARLQISKGWEEWEALPLEIRAKVDPRILAELRGKVLPAHQELEAERAPLPPAGQVRPVEGEEDALWKARLRSGGEGEGEHPKDATLARTRFLVILQAQANLEAVQARARTSQLSLAQQRTAVADALVATAQNTQEPVKRLLDAHVTSGDTAAYFPYYIVNGFAVEGNLATVIALAKRTDVQRIRANYRLVPLDGSGQVDPTLLASISPSKQRPSARAENDGLSAENDGLSAANWNIDRVDAERVWDELGIDGQGAVVADFDTGVDWDHVALQARYRGWDGTAVDHNYNWFEFDARTSTYWDPNGDYGPSSSTTPRDCSDHGTHTMGTMVGDGGTPDTKIGMAPGAQWIAVPGICERTMPEGYADDIGGIRTFQWLLCPTDLSGDLSTRDCSKAPDVVNNSWGSSNPADDTFRPIVQALRAAGIVPVFAAGNPSAGPGSIGSPASIPEAIAVGATDRNDAVTSFSGLGPSFYDGVQKPELAAPGQSVLSSVPGDSYASSSGTSMAAPHVAGLIALMVSADLRDGKRDLTVDELQTFMQYSALDLGPPGPDDEYGYGRIDAYHAVRWVLGAGDLQGAIRNANTKAPIDGATMTGVESRFGDRFAARADARGTYSATVPGGTYDVHVEAFGYTGRTFAGVNVFTGTDTLVDFDLSPLPTRLLTGQVRTGDAASGTTPVSGARVYVDVRPALSYTTGKNGAYALRLPIGQHDITVEAAGYRIEHVTVTLGDAGASQPIDLIPAPSILLVEADGYLGWYGGRPVHNFFQYALDARGFLYDTHIITDTASPPELVLAQPYDVVIWAHTYGSPGVSGPRTVEALTDYLDNGGRLILSGQDIGYWDGPSSNDQPYYAEYLHARYQIGAASGLGGTVTGSRFLHGLGLTLNGAALYDYPNTALSLSPDGIAPIDGDAYPILRYDNGAYDAALAIDPCDQPFRAVYLAVGYENLGPRGDDRPPEYLDLLERSIAWVVGTKSRYDVDLALTPAEQVGQPQAMVQYDLTLANTGLMPDTYDLSVTGHAWQTRMYSGSAEAPPSVVLQPCSHLDLTVQVSVPAEAKAGASDTFEIVAASRTDPSVVARARATTVAFVPWQVETPMPTPRYRLAAAHLPGSVYYYAIGGLGGDSWSVPMDANERYNACTGEWDLMAPMPTPRGNVSAAVIGNKIYVPGGYAADGSTSERLDILEIYDLASDSWASGAPLPEALSGVAAAAYGGKLYAFGGASEADLVDKTYQYDPLSDTWEEKAPMPGGGRGFAAAATLNDKIYVVGGWYVNTVEVYDPQTDTWTRAAPMREARQSPGLAAAPDGRLYVSGGGTDAWEGLRSTERYDPALDAWQVLPRLNDGNRAGSASAYAGGRIYAIGGVDNALNDVNESLQLLGSFCLSSKEAHQELTYPLGTGTQVPALASPRPHVDLAPPKRNLETGTRISYTITLHDDAISLSGASMVDPLPPGTTFGGFGDNAAGATYNTHLNRVEWSGDIRPESPPLSFTFGIDANLAERHNGDTIVNEATFDSGTGLVFTRTATTRLDFPDPSSSLKTVDKRWATSGDRLTYTLHIENPSVISDVITLVDPLPVHTSYVPGSLTYSAGEGAYDEGAQAILWLGILPDLISYQIASYEWGDSDGRGTVPGVTPDWHDMTGATNTGVNADDGIFGTFPIGFPFDFWDTRQQAFYVSPNGWIGFSDDGGSIVSCSDYGSSSTPDHFVGGFGGDRAIYERDGGSITYKLFGTAPDRRLVVQFTNIRYRFYSDEETLDMQIVLYEKSREILVQYRDLTTSPTTTATGIEGPAPDYPYQQYGNACPTDIREGLAILFRPQLMPVTGHSAELSYAVTVDESTPTNTWITNTATLASAYVTVQRRAGTLINPVDLSASHKEAPYQVSTGQTVPYTLILRNTGTRPVNGASLSDPLPPHTIYAPGSLACSGGACTYDAAGQAVRWAGGIAPGGTVTVSFAAALTGLLPDRTPITNTATLEDGYGYTHELRAVTLARTPDLSQSQKQVTPDVVRAGEIVTYTIHVYNAGMVDTTADLHDPLPGALTYVPGSLVCGIGTCRYDAGTVTWMGTIRGESMVPIQFRATVSANARSGEQIINRATVTDRATGQSFSIAAAARLPGPEWQKIYLPFATQNGR